jgi:DNA-binding transcriptional LysR family regulator
MATIDLETLRVFHAVAVTQSFTKAAARLSLDKSSVSRLIRALEDALDTQLLVRSTRSVRLTAEGEALDQRITPALVELEQALAATPDRAAAPSGEVVITTTPDLGRALLAPALPGFRERHPAVRVRVVLGHDVLDLVGDDVDLALRVGHPGGDSLVAKKLGELEAGFFASPGYLVRRGTPMTPADLAGHEGLWPAPPKGQRAFASGAGTPRAQIECDDFGLLAATARAGGGVALLPTFVAAADVAAGALVRVLPGLAFAGAPLYLVSRAARTLPPRVAALRTWLLEHRLGPATDAAAGSEA